MSLMIMKEAIIFYDNRSTRPRACVLTSNLLEATMLRQLLQYQVSRKRKNDIVASEYFSYDYKCLMPSHEAKDLVLNANPCGFKL